jgi:quinol monooxygenase YgiN
MNQIMRKALFRTLLLGALFTQFSYIANAQVSDRMYRIAKIKVDASQLEKYKAALHEQMNAAIKLEPGVLSYTAVADKKDPTSFTLLEVYANKEAYQAHVLTPHFKKYKETVKDWVLSLELLDVDLVASAKKEDF